MIVCDCHPFKTTQLIKATTGDCHFKEIPSFWGDGYTRVKVTVTARAPLDNEGSAIRDSHNKHIR